MVLTRNVWRKVGDLRKDARPPIPPPDMRALVGPVEVAAFDNPSGDLVYPYIEPAAYRAVFDFGCGCGRVARQMMLQRDCPEQYRGVDLHAGMIAWCREMLTPYAPGFEFVHHDVFDDSFNPGEGKPSVAALPGGSGEFTFFNAISVFTHIVEDHVPFYLQEAARLLSEDGVAHISFLLFDKREFPFMQPHTNALYVSWEHPSAAVTFDRGWLIESACAAGLTVVGVRPPPIRGYQWVLEMRRSRPGLEGIALPPDEAPLGEVVLPGMPADASKIGL
jgi:SAM-dependent methyltransferase